MNILIESGVCTKMRAKGIKAVDFIREGVR